MAVRDRTVPVVGLGSCDLKVRKWTWCMPA